MFLAVFLYFYLLPRQRIGWWVSEYFVLTSWMSYQWWKPCFFHHFWPFLTFFFNFFCDCQYPLCVFRYFLGLKASRVFHLSYTHVWLACSWWVPWLLIIFRLFWSIFNVFWVSQYPFCVFRYFLGLRASEKFYLYIFQILHLWSWWVPCLLIIFSTFLVYFQCVLGFSIFCLCIQILLGL
jgi:hypothetical protein